MKPTNNKFLTRRGFGVHSPWAYDFIINVIQEKLPYYAYDDLYDFCEDAPEELPQFDQDEDELLLRVTNSLAVRGKDSLRVLEVGTGSATSTVYMASVGKAVKCVTIDAPHPLTAQVRNSLSDFENIDYRSGNVRELLEKYLSEIPQGEKIDLVHIAHTAFFREVMEEILPYLGPQSMVVTHDIHAIPAKHDWWRQIVADARVASTFTKDETGILSFDLKKHKYNYHL